MGEHAMKMSDHGLAFLIGWEGARSKPYDDGGPGRGNCTVGVGHLIHYGPCTQAELDQPALSLTEINRLLRADVGRFEASVNALGVSLNQNQYDALVSFAFNCGAGALQSFAGDIMFMRAFVHDGAGNTLDALVRRREAEIQLYETPVEDDMPCKDDPDFKALQATVLDLAAKLYPKIDAIASALADHATRLHALDGK